jgi:hypothetical protein
MCRFDCHRGSRLADRAAVCVLLLIFSGGFSNLPADDLVTGDGLTVRVNGSGRVTGVQLAGDELLTTGVTGGFSLTDYTGMNGTNILANSGFEGGFTNVVDNIWVPDNWNLVTATGSADNIMLLADTASPHEGAKALRFVTTQSGFEPEPLARDLIEVASDTFVVDAGTMYYCTSVCRSSFGYSRDLASWYYDPEVYLDFYDDTQALLSSTKVFAVQQTYYNWTRFTGWAKAPQGSVAAAVRISVSGNVIDYGASIDLLFDDMSCFREPAGIRDIPVSGTVTNTAGVLDLLAVNVGGRGLDVSARMEALSDRIEVSGTVTPTAGQEGQDRALDLSFVLPVDTSSMYWFWYDGPHKRYRIQQQYIYDEVVAADAASPNLKVNVYNLSCISDGDHVLNIGRDPDIVRPYYVQYEAEDDHYVVRFQMGLAAERDHVSFDFIIYTSLPNWDFRGAVQDYYDIYTDYGRLRQVGGQPMAGGINGGHPESIIGMPFGTNPEDFAVRYYLSGDAADAEYLTDTLGLQLLFYMRPWCVTYESSDENPPPPYSELRNAINKQPSVLTESWMCESFPADYLININDTSNQDYLLYRIADFPWKSSYQYYAAVYLNTEDLLPSFGNRYIDQLDEVYQHFLETLESEDYLWGVMMDLTNIGGAALDGSRSRFASAGYDLTYSAATFKPALWNLNAFQTFMGSVQDHLETTQPDHDVVSANVIEYGYLFSAANHLDTFGFECSPITGWNWNNKHLDYRKIMAGSKPFSPVPMYSDTLVFDEPSGEYYKGMCDMYNIALLYAFYLDPHKFCDLMNKDLEELRGVSAGVVPYIDEFMELGWNPCHKIQLVDEDNLPITDNYTQIERYGPSEQFDSGETVYVVAHYNDANLKVFDTFFPRPGSLAETRDFRMLIDLDDIGMTEPVTLEEMTASMHDMAPVIPPNLVLTNNGDGTVTITGTIVWRDTLVLKLKEYIPDSTPPAVPTGVAAAVILP